MTKNNYFILTGAMGAGKTSVLNKLKEKHYCVDEPARGILKAQREINGDGVPEKNPKLFNKLMLEQLISQYKENAERKDIIIYDRGIPDVVAYAELLNTDSKSSHKASEEFRYNKNIFMFNGWEEIYTNDDERKIDFNTANKFGSNLRKIYESLDYYIVDVPFVSVDERVSFITDTIKRITLE